MDVCRFSSLVIGLKTEISSNAFICCIACSDSFRFFIVVVVVVQFSFYLLAVATFVRAYIIMICICTMKWSRFYVDVWSQFKPCLNNKVPANFLKLYTDQTKCLQTHTNGYFFSDDAILMSVVSAHICQTLKASTKYMVHSCLCLHFISLLIPFEMRCQCSWIPCIFIFYGARCYLLLLIRTRLHTAYVLYDANNVELCVVVVSVFFFFLKKRK